MSGSISSDDPAATTSAAKITIRNLDAASKDNSTGDGGRCSSAASTSSTRVRRQLPVPRVNISSRTSSSCLSTLSVKLGRNLGVCEISPKKEGDDKFSVVSAGVNDSDHQSVPVLICVDNNFNVSNGAGDQTLTAESATTEAKDVKKKTSVILKTDPRRTGTKSAQATRSSALLQVPSLLVGKHSDALASIKDCIDDAESGDAATKRPQSPRRQGVGARKLPSTALVVKPETEKMRKTELSSTAAGKPNKQTSTGQIALRTNANQVKPMDDMMTIRNNILNRKGKINNHSIDVKPSDAPTTRSDNSTFSSSSLFPQNRSTRSENGRTSLHAVLLTNNAGQANNCMAVTNAVQSPPSDKLKSIVQFGHTKTERLVNECWASKLRPTVSPDSESECSSVSISSRSSILSTKSDLTAASLKAHWASRRLSAKQKLSSTGPTQILRASKISATQASSPSSGKHSANSGASLADNQFVRNIRSTDGAVVAHSQPPDVVANSLQATQPRCSPLPPVHVSHCNSSLSSSVLSSALSTSCTRSNCVKVVQRLNETLSDLRRSMIALEAMIVVVNHASHQTQIGAVQKSAGSRVTFLEKQLATAVSKNAVMLCQRDALIDEIQSIKESYELQLNGMLVTHHMELASCENNYQAALQSAEDRHQQEVMDMNQRNIEQIERIKQEAETKCKQLLLEQQEKLCCQLSEAENKHRIELTDFKKQQDNRVKELSTQFEQFKAALLAKFNKQQCEHCSQSSATIGGSQLTFAGGNPVAALSTAGPAVQSSPTMELLQQETASLRIVLELRTAEINKLKNQNIELDKQLQELHESKETVRKLQQKLENAEAIVEQKSDYDRQLAEKHNTLLRKLEKESKVNKRLSLENEELEWKLSNAEGMMLQPSSPDIMRRSWQGSGFFPVLPDPMRLSLQGLNNPPRSNPGTPRVEKRRIQSTSSSSSASNNLIKQ